MKKRLVGLALALVALLVVALLVASFFLGSIIKRGVEKAGPAITKVDVKLANASLAVFSGNGRLKGLVIGNPEGFKSPSAIQVGVLDVSVVPRSILSDKVVVRSIQVEAPEVTFEGGLQGNNLSKLLDNIRGGPAKEKPSTPAQNSSASRKIEVDDLLVTGGKIHLSVDLLGARTATVPLPEIHLSGLGQGPEGITAAELSEKLLNEVLQAATKAVAGEISSMGKNIGNLGNAAQNISTGAVQQVDKVTKGLGDLLKRK